MRYSVMEKKITKREMFEQLKAVVLTAEVENVEQLVAFIEHEVELLNKKSASKSKAEIEKANANVELTQIVREVLANSSVAMTVSEIMKANEVLAEFSNQKVSYLMRVLVENKEVVKTVEKGKSYFKLV
jgi:hypothetical protein